MIQNDADAIGLFLSDDWTIIDPDGDVIDKPRFLAVIRSGALKHESHGLRGYSSTHLAGLCYGHGGDKYQKQIFGERVLDARKGYGRLREEEWAVAMRTHSPYHLQQENPKSSTILRAWSIYRASFCFVRLVCQ